MSSPAIVAVSVFGTEPDTTTFSLEEARRVARLTQFYLDSHAKGLEPQYLSNTFKISYDYQVMFSDSFGNPKCIQRSGENVNVFDNSRVFDVIPKHDDMCPANLSKAANLMFDAMRLYNQGTMQSQMLSHSITMLSRSIRGPIYSMAGRNKSVN